MLTSKEYAEKLGRFCPQCGSEDDIEGNQVEIDAGGAWQEISCLGCGATWDDVYVLTGFANLEPGEG